MCFTKGTSKPKDRFKNITLECSLMLVRTLTSSRSLRKPSKTQKSAQITRMLGEMENKAAKAGKRSALKREENEARVCKAIGLQNRSSAPSSPSCQRCATHLHFHSPPLAAAPQRFPPHHHAGETRRDRASLISSHLVLSHHGGNFRN